MDRPDTHGSQPEPQVADIRFLGEQDGVPEREFKQAIAGVLKDVVERAYLARIEYANTGVKSVALCLRAKRPDESLVKTVGKVFSRMFGVNQHLDIVFLNQMQERQLELVCRPFIESGP